jgi:hypothetical protein
MKKFFFMLIAVIFIFPLNAYAEENDYETEESEIMSLAEALHATYPQFHTEDEITFVPLRRIAEAMGFTVFWNSIDRSVPIYHADGQIFAVAFIGRKPPSAEAAPIIREGRTYVPISFFDILF